MQCLPECRHPLDYPHHELAPLKRRLCRGLDLGQRLPLLESSLLLQSHDLESVKIRQSLPSLLLQALLGPVGLLPLRVDLGLLPELLDGACPRTSGELLNNHLGEQAAGEGDGLSRDSEFGIC